MEQKKLLFIGTMKNVVNLNILTPQWMFLKSYPDWMKDSMLTYAKEGACFLSISASNPELLKDVDPKKIAAAQKIF